MITVLTGGTGGSKFVWGLAQVIPSEQLTVIVNTGDDLKWWDLHVSPDLDSVMYALAGKLSRERGWGYDDDSFCCLNRMRGLGAEAWFQLGDLDLATHLRRTQLLSQGKSLSEATAELCAAMGVGPRILPMSDDAVETRVITPHGDLTFQEFFVRERFQPEVLDVKFVGVEQARSARGVLEAIARADAVFIAPSNPVTSIEPILAVPGIRDVLRNCTAAVAAISPIVGGDAISGPAGKLMRMWGRPVSPAGIAESYCDIIDLVIADKRDESELPQIERGSVGAAFTNTIMQSDGDRIALARFALEAVAHSTETKTPEAVR